MSNINVESVKAKIVAFLAQYPAVDIPLTSICGKVGVEKAYVALTFALIPLLIIFIMGSGHFIIDLIGFIYPMYSSIKAIESQDKEDDSLWLTYWLVFCLFKIVEGVADVLISMIPFYFLGKMGFLIWCYSPSTKGAKIVYESVIKPFIVPALGLDGIAKKGEVPQPKYSPRTTVRKESIKTLPQYRLSVTIKRVTMEKERNVFLECCCIPPESRVRSGVEGLLYKTTPTLGTHAVFNQELKFLPVPSLDGSLVIDVREKLTFEEGSSVGKVTVLISSLTNGKEVAVSIVNDKEERLTVTYFAEAVLL